jgi:hypothetical protein
MIEVSMSLPEASAATFLAKLVGWPGRAWHARQARASMAGMSEREFQDIGWGQTDRWSTELNFVEPPEDRRARAVARKAWLTPTRKAA